MSIPFILSLHLGLELESDSSPAGRDKGHLTRCRKGKWWGVDWPLGSPWDTSPW